MAKVKFNLYASQPQDEEPIYDPVTYQTAFEKLNQAVFIRQSMMAPAPAPAVAEAAPAAPLTAAAAPAPAAPVTGTPN